MKIPAEEKFSEFYEKGGAKECNGRAGEDDEGSGLCQVEYIERDSRCPESVDFLAGTCMLQIQLRQWGKRR
ncbi:hypothetical protein SLA2020_515650 [Shorea laevis]